MKQYKQLGQIGMFLSIALLCSGFLITDVYAKKTKQKQTTNSTVTKREKKVMKHVEPVIGVSDQDRETSVTLLNKRLADEFVLLAQTLNYHWNLVGPEFRDYHLMFNDQYELIFDQTDLIAERVRALGGVALGSLTKFAKGAELKEDNGPVPTPKEMVANLLSQHEAFIRSLRADINKTATSDIGSSNMLTDLIEKHEKIAWMLRSLLN